MCGKKLKPGATPYKATDPFVMKKTLLLAALLLAAAAAHAQDKPVLNSAPPGLPPPTTAPVPEVAPPPAPTRPQAPELPSNRDVRQAGATSDGIGNKLFLYTNLGLGYSGYNGYSQFSVSLAPAIGYRLTERVAVGPGISYAYNSYGFGNSSRSAVSTSSFGVKVFGQVKVIDQFFVHGEYEVTSAELLYQDQSNNLVVLRRQLTTPLAGIGYRNQFSDRAAGDVLFLYNFASAINSIYPNPVIRFCFMFNLGR